MKFASAGCKFSCLMNKLFLFSIVIYNTTGCTTLQNIHLSCKFCDFGIFEISSELFFLFQTHLYVITLLYKICGMICVITTANTSSEPANRRAMGTCGIKFQHIMILIRRRKIAKLFRLDSKNGNIR